MSDEKIEGMLASVVDDVQEAIKSQGEVFEKKIKELYGRLSRAESALVQQQQQQQQPQQPQPSVSIDDEIAKAIRAQGAVFDAKLDDLFGRIEERNRELQPFAQPQAQPQAPIWVRTKKGLVPAVSTPGGLMPAIETPPGSGNWTPIQGYGGMPVPTPAPNPYIQQSGQAFFEDDDEGLSTGELIALGVAGAAVGGLATYAVSEYLDAKNATKAFESGDND